MTTLNNEEDELISDIDDIEIIDENENDDLLKPVNYKKVSYRYFFDNEKLKTSNELKQLNKNAPTGVKFCNGFCQDYVLKDNFAGQRTHCRDCDKKIRKFNSLTDKKNYSIEDFRKNPDIINDIETVINCNKVCINCKQTKSLNEFSDKKNSCKSCRLLQSKVRSNEKLKPVLTEIERLKNNIDLLTKYLENSVSRDILILVLTNYNLKRHSSKDRKAEMMNYIIEYFKQSMNSKICRGGCGRVMVEDFGTCNICLNKKKKPRGYERTIAFRDNLDEIVKNIKPIESHEKEMYNKEQFYEITQKLGINIKKSDCTKDDLITYLNKFLTEREEKEQEGIKEEELRLFQEKHEEKKYQLDFNGIIINSRKEDGFIDATSLCKAGGKEFKNWYRLDSTKELIKEFEIQQKIEYEKIYSDKKSVAQKIPTKVIDIIQGGSAKLQGSWIHPDLAVQIAQWISPAFAIKVSKWTRELLLFGNVKLGEERNENLLIERMKQENKELQRKTIELEKENLKLLKNHNQILKKRQYHTFKKGSVFYIFVSNDGRMKLGFEGISVDDRLESHRTTQPDLKVVCICYTEKAYLLEQIMLSRYETKKVALSHEVLDDIDVKHVLESVKHFVDYGRFEATFETEDEIEKYNSTI